MALTLPDAVRHDLIEAIQHHFRTERDEELGTLAAGFLLDFVLETIGPSIYNQGLRDAQAHLHRTVTDLDVVLGLPEPARR